MTTKAKLGELMWEHRLRAAAAVAFLAVAVVSISAVGPRLGAVVSFFWPLLVSTLPTKPPSLFLKPKP